MADSSSFINQAEAWWLSLGLAVLLFLLPANFFWQVQPQMGYVHGLRIDYLIPKLYASDLWLVGMLATSIVLSFIKQKHPVVTNTAIGLLGSWAAFTVGIAWLCQSYASDRWLVTIWSWLWLLLHLGAGWWFWQQRHLFKTPLLITGLATSIFFQVALGSYQWFAQRSLAGYWLLGEPNLHRVIGLATTSWFGQEKMLPYGTSPHPNVLAGILVGYSLLLVWVIKNKLVVTSWQRLLVHLGILVGIGGIVLTQSWSAAAAGLLALTFMFIPSARRKHLAMSLSLIVFLVIPLALQQLDQRLPTSPSIHRRVLLNTAAQQLFVRQPWLGVGLQQFTTQLESSLTWPEVVRFIQPTHHLGLLWLAETGLIGAIICGTLLVRFLYKLPSPLSWWLCFLIPLATLDHYLLTGTPGQLLIIVTGLLAGCWLAPASLILNQGKQSAKGRSKS